MISLSGVIGKVIEFVVAKLAGHRIDLALDEKKRAAKAFVGLHDALTDLEALTREFMTELDRVGNGKARLYSVWLRGFQGRVDAATSNFVRYGNDLMRAVTLLDPVLAAAIGKVGFGKMKVFISASKLFEEAPSAFRLHWNNDKEVLLTSVELRSTKDVELLSIDRLYDVAKLHRPEQRRRDGVSFDLLDDLIRDRLVDFSFTPTDSVAIGEAARVIRTHLKTLERARESLRRFISTSFAIDDLLYVTRVRE